MNAILKEEPPELPESVPAACAAARPSAVLRGNFQHFPRRKSRLPQRLAFYKFGDHIRHAIAAADVVESQDVRMVQRGDRPSFLLEPVPRSFP
jgi:hypothetical protein